MDTGTLRLITFSFILSILFPTFSYTFTSFGTEALDFDITLDSDKLVTAGIVLTGASNATVTYGGPAVEFTVKNETMRVQWKEPPGPAQAYFSNQKRGWVQDLFDTWWNAIEMDVIVDVSEGVRGPAYVTNFTVINYWEPSYNWTMYQCVDNSLFVFITTRQQDDNNITHAVFDEGIVMVTVGSGTMSGGEDMSAITFLNWYRTVVFNGGSQWGLPTFMTWVIRIFSFMMVLSGILLAKELREFLPI